MICESCDEEGAVDQTGHGGPILCGDCWEHLLNQVARDYGMLRKK